MSSSRPTREDERADVPPLPEPFAGPLDIRSVALTGLFVLATLYTLHFARPFLIPIVLAVLLSFILTPAIRLLKRIGIPELVGSGLVLLLLLGVGGYGVYKLATPAAAWMATAPESLRRAEYKFRALRRSVEQMTKAAEQVENMTTVESGNEPPEVSVKSESLSDTVVTSTQGFLGGALVMVILLFFLLASGNLFLRKVVRMLPRLEDKKRAVEIARQIEDQISTYLVSVTLINAGLGALVALTASLVGLPNPILWGVMVAVTKFVPYLGPLASLIVLTLVGVMSFEELRWALVTPTVYFALDVLEANLVTPMILGRRLALNPVVIFLAVTFWAWLWGIGGALLAVPMLAVFKILCDHIEPLAPFGEFLGP